MTTYMEAVQASADSIEAWKWLITLKCNSLSLSRDDNHACNYMTAAQWIDAHAEDYADTDPQEVERMKATNTIWQLQIYPNTPVGFNVWYGATADCVVRAAFEDYRKGETP